MGKTDTYYSFCCIFSFVKNPLLKETTSTAICWTIGFLIRHPRVQLKLHEEMDRCVGSDRWIVTEDRKDLHYLNAVVLVCCLTFKLNSKRL